MHQEQEALHPEEATGGLRLRQRVTIYTWPRQAQGSLRNLPF
jgi:hypothetical protein